MVVDIRGTNEFNAVSSSEWFSILVETGVHNAGDEPKYTPKATVTNVLEAVKLGMKRSTGQTLQGRDSLDISSRPYPLEEKESGVMLSGSWSMIEPPTPIDI